MAYVPPHKRQSKAQKGLPPSPAHLLPKFEKSCNLHSSRYGSSSRTHNSILYGKKIINADDSILKWLVVQLMDDAQLPSSLCLVPACVESTEMKSGENLLTLVKGHSQQDDHDKTSRHLEHTWATIAETVHKDLLSTIQNVRKEMADHGLEETKTTVVARFGKVLFRRNQDCATEIAVSESYIRNLRRSFYTNLEDVRRPESTISCKCKVRRDEQKLELYKIELSAVRHMVEDISILDSDIDLRLALYTKRILTLQDDEEETIKDLIGSAIFDPNVKGGLRWPLGKANSGGHYSIVGVWHTKAEAYGNSLMRVKMREADRFDFLTTTGEVTRELSLKLIGITRNLLEQGSEVVGLTMLEDALKLIQNLFLSWKGTLA